ncbi:MAG: hypothetical protein FWD49_04870 [Firmicutes bacterium]|nr:hypothetical protein [Bacillota bacterium]
MVKNILKTALLFVVFSALVCALFACGNGGEVSPQIVAEEIPESGEISTAGHLVWLSNRVNGGERFFGRDFTLVNDIDLLGIEWIPMGSGTATQYIDALYVDAELDYGNYFAGNFNGNGKKITNFKITKEYEYVGFFGRNAGTIENLAISDFFINVDANHGIEGISDEWEQGRNMIMVFAGGIAGRNYGIIDNCSSNGDIKISVKNVGRHSFAVAGGIVAANWVTGTIKNSHSLGSVQSFADVESVSAGIAGGNYGNILNCYANGDITALTHSDAYAGGLVSRNHGTVKDSHATGNVKALIQKQLRFNSSSFAGGLMAGNWSSGIIDNCYALGEVTASGGVNAFAGGLTGECAGKIYNSRAEGNVLSEAGINAVAGGFSGTFNSWSEEKSALIENCNAFGNATAHGSMRAYAGGFVGFLEGAFSIVRDSYAHGSAEANALEGDTYQDPWIAFVRIIEY